MLENESSNSVSLEFSFVCCNDKNIFSTTISSQYISDNEQFNNLQHWVMNHTNEYGNWFFKTLFIVVESDLFKKK